MWGFSHHNARKVVDGQKFNLSFSSRECFESGHGYNFSIWFVNLTSIYSIRKIRIYYPTDNKNIGKCINKCISVSLHLSQLFKFIYFACTCNRYLSTDFCLYCYSLFSLNGCKNEKNGGYIKRYEHETTGKYVKPFGQV